MAEAKKKKLELWTPRLTGIHPWLQKPDYKYDVAGAYRTYARGPAGEFAVMQTILQPILEAYVQKTKDEAQTPEKQGKLANSKTAAYFKDILGADGKPTGEKQANFKMKALITYKEKDGSETQKKLKPKVWDSKGQATRKNPWSGSVLRTLFYPSPYYSAKDNEFGLSLKLIGCQIIKLVEAGERDAVSYGLEVAEDGFTDDFDSDMPNGSGDEAAGETKTSGENPAAF